MWHAGVSTVLPGETLADDLDGVLTEDSFVGAGQAVRLLEAVHAAPEGGYILGTDRGGVKTLG